MASQLCSEINGGDCKNRVSARNGFVCAAGHRQENHKVLLAKPKIEKREDPRALYQIAEDPSTPLEELYLLLQKGASTLLSLAWNTSIDYKMQKELMRRGQKNTGILESLASNPTLDVSFQRELLDMGGEQILRCLASNRGLDVSLQDELIDSPYDEVRKGLAGNSSVTDIERQRKLSLDDYQVQVRLGGNPSLHSAIAIDLIGHGLVPIIGFAKNKTMEDLLKPENLSLLKKYPVEFGEAYLARLTSGAEQDSADENDQRRTLVMHAYNLYEKNTEDQRLVSIYKRKILDIYEGDQEVRHLLEVE